MNVLSLFDGISCARVALDRVGIPVKTYYASEIDKNAIQVSHKNYPDIVRLGDVREIRSLDEPIDLLIGGSPCQDLSIAKKGRRGLEGDRSSLFWEYKRLLDTLKPKYFVLENVASMPKKDKDIITKELGVEPVLFDAALVSAQSRKRFFWTNIKFDLPADRGIVLKDVLEPEVDDSMVVSGKAFHPVLCNETRTLHKIGYVGNTDSQTNRVYSPEGKAPTQCKGPNGGALPTLVSIGRDIGRRLNAEGHREDYNKDLPIQRRIELRTDEKSGTLTSVLKDNMVVTGIIYAGHLEGSQRKGTEGQEHLSRAHAQSNRVYSPDGKSPTLSASETSGRTHVVDEMRVRKLTPTECERLQCLPDGYTEGVAKTHRYKCLGNAFNVDVIAHILTAMRNTTGAN